MKVADSRKIRGLKSGGWEGSCERFTRYTARVAGDQSPPIRLWRDAALWIAVAVVAITLIAAKIWALHDQHLLQTRYNWQFALLQNFWAISATINRNTTRQELRQMIAPFGQVVRESTDSIGDWTIDASDPREGYHFWFEIRNCTTSAGGSWGYGHSLPALSAESAYWAWLCWFFHVGFYLPILGILVWVLCIRTAKKRNLVWLAAGSAVCLLASSMAVQPDRLFNFSSSLIPSAILLILSIVGQWIPNRAVNHMPRCKACGYNLTGNESGVCPECGKPRQLAKDLNFDFVP